MQHSLRVLEMHSFIELYIRIQWLLHSAGNIPRAETVAQHSLLLSGRYLQWVRG